MITRTAVTLSCALMAGWLAFGGPPSKSGEWKDWDFLIGEWVGEGSGKPGEGVGAFTFKSDLDGKVLIRRNKSDYPAAHGRPAFSHEDLMVIYHDPIDKHARAVYFDNEGHVINYTVQPSKNNQKRTFVSDKSSPGPQFRLTYTRKDERNVEILFEMAQAGQKEFTPYTKGTAHRN